MVTRRVSEDFRGFLANASGYQYTQLQKTDVLCPTALSTWQQALPNEPIFMSQNSFFRIVDAAANRTAEGLRVAEDVMRMHLNDRHLSLIHI